MQTALSDVGSESQPDHLAIVHGIKTPKTFLLRSEFYTYSINISAKSFIFLQICNSDGFFQKLN